MPTLPGSSSGHGDADSLLPAPLTTLVGREVETAAVSALLRREDVRLVTLTGPGGVGKTRLALRVAAEVTADFADGIRFVPLAAIADPGLVLSTMARALGVRDTGDRPLVEQLHALLRPRALLLILDNLEQVLPAAPDLAGLLTACPRLTILATSRTLLRVSGEHGYPAPPLPLPKMPAGGQRLTGPQVAAQAARSDAVRLFVDRAQAVNPRLTLTERTLSSRTVPVGVTGGAAAIGARTTLGAPGRAHRSRE